MAANKQSMVDTLSGSLGVLDTQIRQAFSTAMSGTVMYGQMGTCKNCSFGLGTERLPKTAERSF